MTIPKSCIDLTIMPSHSSRSQSNSSLKQRMRRQWETPTKRRTCFYVRRPSTGSRDSRLTDRQSARRRGRRASPHMKKVATCSIRRAFRCRSRSRKPIRPQAIAMLQSRHTFDCPRVPGQRPGGPSCSSSAGWTPIKPTTHHGRRSTSITVSQRSASKFLAPVTVRRRRTTPRRRIGSIAGCCGAGRRVPSHVRRGMDTCPEPNGVPIRLG